MLYSAAALFFATWSLSSNVLCTCLGSSISNSISSPPTISSGVNVFPDMDNELFLTRLSKKVSLVANIPIFEFGQDLTEFLSGNVDPSTLLDLELIFYDYMSKLRSYYFLIYSNFERVTLSDGLQPIRLNLMQERDYCVDQCRKAMKSALPVSTGAVSWSFQGPLLELESDINTAIEDAMNNLPDSDGDSLTAQNPSSKKRLFFSKKFLRRFRWVGIQLALLAFNFTQNEWHRRSKKHLADRRMAEVPEFPLL